MALARELNPVGGGRDYSGPVDWGRTIWARRWVILLLFSVMLATAVVMASLVPPTYKAQAILEVLPDRQPNSPANPLTNAAADEVKLNTEAQKIGAEPVVRAVFEEWSAGQFGPIHADNGEIAQTPTKVRKWIGNRIDHLCSESGRYSVFQPLCSGNPERSEEENFRAFQSHLVVTAERDTLLIKVVFTAPNPQIAANVVNAVIAEYLNKHVDQVDIQSNRYVNWLNGRIAALRSQAAKSDEAVARYRGQTGLIEIGQARPTSPTVAELEYSLQESSSARAAMTAARIKLDMLQALRQNPSQIKSAIEVVDSKLIQDLTLQKAEEEAKVAGLLATYTVDTPVLTRARAAIKAIQGQIDQEIDRLLDATERQYAATAALANLLDHRVADLKARISQEDMERVTLQELQRRANADSDLYAAYLRQAREAIEAASWQPLAATVVARAMPPVEAMFPHSQLSLPLGVIASALAATIMGALIELRRQQRVFRSPMDIRGATGVRVVGAIPKVRRPTAALPPGGFSAAIENVAFRISSPKEDLLSSPLGIGSTISGPANTGILVRPLSVAVTSAVANEGKSVLASSLAKEFRFEGARVLIIDADIRQPSILDALRTTEDYPVSVVNYALDGTAQRTVSDDTGLHVLELAGMEPNPRVTLAALPRLISNLKQYYDILVVDTPPLLVVSDALAAIPACDQVLFAVKWGSTSREELEFALQELNETDLARTGIVLTNFEGRPYMRSGTAGTHFCGSRPAFKRGSKGFPFTKSSLVR